MIELEIVLYLIEPKRGFKPKLFKPRKISDYFYEFLFESTLRAFERPAFMKLKSVPKAIKE